ncbi:MAG TPA: cytochrome c maturation protein CcmE [Sphingomicrobium sp.]|nr:cytochrome c maturation protein CcmE [Sphingomicrobium sp.]
MTAKPKQQRLVLVVLALIAGLAAVLLAMWGLKDRAAYFYTPADVAAGKAREDQAMRLGGMVTQGSLRREADGVTVGFLVEDGGARTPVRYRGILPDLFREGSGVVAEGRMQGATFVAENILAKHDERYMPPQLGNQASEHGVGQTLER